jgi:hypothetical protein
VTSRLPVADLRAKFSLLSELQNFAGNRRRTSVQNFRSWVDCRASQEIVGVRASKVFDLEWIAELRRKSQAPERAKFSILSGLQKLVADLRAKFSLLSGLQSFAGNRRRPSVQNFRSWVDCRSWKPIHVQNFRSWVDCRSWKPIHVQNFRSWVDFWALYERY